jgi:hypothetical protein
MIGCMTETFVGLSAGIFMAAGNSGFDYIDLDSVHFLYRCGDFKSIIIENDLYRIAEQQQSNDN